MKATLLFIILAITGGVYANSLTGVFQFDDYAVQTWLEGGMTDFVSKEMGISHRPLPYFTYWLNWKIGGANVIGYHLANLLVHFIAVALVFFLVDHLIGGDPISAAFGAAVFAVHPFFSSSVSYVYARGSMMAAMFVFAAALAALKIASRWKWLVVPAFLGMGALCKEEALIAPALFLGYAVINGHRKAARLLTLAMVAGLVAVMVLAPHVQTIFNTPLADMVRPAPDLILNYGAWPSAAEHLKGVLSGYVFHTLGNLILPLHLTPDPAMVFDWRWIVALAVILAMAALALWPRVASDLRMGLWALLCCPILGALVILVAEPLFEYRAYMLGLGVALMAGALFRRLQRLRPAPVLAAMTLAAFAAGTVQRNQAWATVVNLWSDANKKDPAKKRAVLNLSAALLKQKRDLEAERVLLDSLKIHQKDFKAAHVNLAAVYIENRQCDAGEYHARLGVPVPLAYVYIAICQTGGGHYEDAIANVETAARLDPKMVYAQTIRLSILDQMGRSGEELTRLEEQVQKNPDDFMAHATLSVAYRMAGIHEAADEHSRRAKQIQAEKGVE